MKSEFLISNIPTGKLNAMVKNIMAQTGATEPEEAVRMMNSGELQISIVKPKCIEIDGVIYFSVTSDGATGQQWIDRLEKKQFNLSYRIKNIMLSKYFKQNSDFVYDIAVLKGSLFSDKGRTYENILKEARKRNLITPPMQLACLIREKFSDKDLESMGLTWITVMHKTIDNMEFSNLLFNVNSFRESSLDTYVIPSGDIVDQAFPYESFGFAFISSRKSKL